MAVIFALTVTCQVSVAWSAFSCSPAAACSSASSFAAELVAVGLDVEPVVAAVGLIAVGVDYAAVAA